MKNAINAEYSIAPASGLIEKILSSQRRKLFDAFIAFKQSEGSILNVSAASPGSADCLIAWSSPQQRTAITTFHIGAKNGATGKRGQTANAMRLPFADGAFDWVVCNEAIERVGDIEKQFALMQELARVSGKGLFVTTSNRRHPIEFNTCLPFMHWLPLAWWRRILKWAGKGKWIASPMLNLVDAATLYKFASLLPGKPEHDVGHKRVFGVKAHFFLMVRKQKPSRPV